MTTSHFLTLSAALLILLRRHKQQQEILLQRRQHTGYRDGWYDLAVSGHVEADESMTQALCREAREEIAIHIQPDDLKFVCLLHKHDLNTTYYNGYFLAQHYQGKPRIAEPDKNAGLEWWPLNNLPEKVIDDRLLALQYYKNGIHYGELGFAKGESSLN